MAMISRLPTEQYALRAMLPSACCCWLKPWRRASPLPTMNAGLARPSNRSCQLPPPQAEKIAGRQPGCLPPADLVPGNAPDVVLPVLSAPTWPLPLPSAMFTLKRCRDTGSRDRMPPARAVLPFGRHDPTLGSCRRGCGSDQSCLAPAPRAAPWPGCPRRPPV